jgi:predicted ribosome quality control (RQC) complex YloA/Tae2 family protein
LVEEYYRLLETRDLFHQFKERLRSEIKLECEKTRVRLDAASKHLGESESSITMKQQGDLILAHSNEIGPGQDILSCFNLFEPGDQKIAIKLNPNLSASQNAQNYYRQFAKHRARKGSASIAHADAANRLSALSSHMEALESAREIDELRSLKDRLSPGRRLENKRVTKAETQNKKPKQRLLQVNSSDAWKIYVGRNRYENDQLLTRLAQPDDIWLHILGQGGAHVLIRVPASKQDPPLSTLREAALLAANMSKAGPLSKVRVVYTKVKYVKKVAKDKPGVVRYEKEKTIEVDMAQPLPMFLKEIIDGQKRVD